MFHLTLFGTTEGDIAPSGFTALTVFGGAELRRPTLASRILHLKRRGDRPPSRWRRLTGSEENFVITVFAGTVVLEPTLVEEFASLQGLMRSGAVTAAELPGLLARASAPDATRQSYRSFTLFGGCVSRRPAEKKERKALESAEREGAMPTATRRTLEALVGSPPGARDHGLGQLLAATAPA